MYYIVFLIGIILSLINDEEGISFNVYVVVLALFAHLRYGVGADYFPYAYLYSRLNPSVICEIRHGIGTQEVLFRAIGSLLKGIGFSYQQYLMILATINLYFTSKIAHKYSKNPTMSMLLYFSFYYLVWTFSALRQGLTMSIGMYYLLQCSEEENTKKIIIITIILLFIHASAIILIPLYFAAKIDFSKRQLLYMTITGMVISLLPLGNILQYFTWIPIVSKIGPYIEPVTGWNSVLDFKSLGRLTFLLIAFLYYDSYTEDDKTAKRIMNIYILSLITYFVFKFSELTAARLSIYGKLLDMVILTNIYYANKVKFNKRIFIVFVLVLASTYLIKELNTLERQTGLQNPNEITVPYTNIYNKDEFKFRNEFLRKLNSQQYRKKRMDKNLEIVDP